MTPFDDGGDPCTRDADCKDALFCNGDEVCLPSNPRANRRGCVRPVPSRSCGDGFSCNERNQTCECVGVDADGDGHAAIGCGDDCDDNNANRFPGNPEVCDGDDEDCNDDSFGGLDTASDADGDGFVSSLCCSGPGRCGSDCDDSVAISYPRAIELCDGRDNDCDGVVDDGVDVMLYPDTDRDGYGSSASGAGRLGCPGTPGFSVLGNDCDDRNAGMVPGAFRCESTGQLTGSLLLCDSATGTYLKLACAAQGLCYPQPNSTGICR